MKILNNLIKIIIIIVSFTYSLSILETSNFYNAIIKLSIIPFLFIPQLLNKLKIIKFTNGIEFIYLIFLFLAHFLGSIVDFYHQVPNYDTLMHFLSGILVSIIATMLIKQNNINQNKLFFNILFILGLSCLVACLWEYMEFTGDNLFNKDAQNVLTTGVDDTMKDMIVATIGSFLYSLIFYIESKTGKKGFISWLLKEK